jgi:AcrR family transcriptional regulator
MSMKEYDAIPKDREARCGHERVIGPDFRAEGASLGARERLLDAALPLFTEQGYAGVSIRELAAAADCNSSLVSYHFGGKEGLYEAVLEREYSVLADRVTELRALDLPPEGRIVRFCRLIMETHRRRPYLMRLMLREMMAPSPMGGRVMGTYVPRFASFVLEAAEEGRKSGVFREDLDPRQAALSLAGMLNFYFIVEPIIHRMFEGAGPGWDESYAMGAVELFFDGVLNRAGKGRDEDA